MARSFPNFKTRWIPAPDVLLVPDELYIDPDLRDATRGEDESRRTLAELTATKTGRILQLANEPIPPSPGSEIWAEITEVDEKLHSIFGKVGFWLKGLGGVNEENPWWDVKEEKSKMCSVRRADAASIEQEQRTRTRRRCMRCERPNHGPPGETSKRSPTKTTNSASSRRTPR